MIIIGITPNTELDGIKTVDCFIWNLKRGRGF